MTMIVVKLLFMCIILLIHKITTLTSNDKNLEQFKAQCLGRYGIIMMLITMKRMCLHTCIKQLDYRE